MSKIMLETKDISIAFGGIKAVSNVSFKVKEGQVVSIIGPNGAGKTTVFNLLTGIYQTQSGYIEYKNKQIQTLAPQEIVKLGIARTFQNIRLIDDMRVIENILIGTHINTKYSLHDSFFKTRKFREVENANNDFCLDLLQKLNLLDKYNEYAGNLPYGDKRKVEIARALATGAKLLLLDEPAAGMNPNESAELMEFIKKLKEIGITVLLIEHDMSVVMKVSDYIYVLENGVGIAEGTPDYIAHDKNVIKAYLGGDLDVEHQ